MIIDEWEFKKLVSTGSGSCSPSNNELDSCLSACSMSGVEIESPHVTLASEKNRSYEIPRIGIISTLWTGQEGRQALMNDYEMEIETPKITALKRELRELASTCLKALVDIQDTKPQVRQAIDMCRNYIPKSSNRIIDNPISDLWKNKTSNSPKSPTNSKELATQVLGEQIVNTITERNKDPPDVSYISLKF